MPLLLLAAAIAALSAGSEVVGRAEDDEHRGGPCGEQDGRGA
ncbi:hypothetical protein [Streptomyces brevispora]|nr:hypothetical protein [Streptomyces brevispora]